MKRLFVNPRHLFADTAIIPLPLLTFSGLYQEGFDRMKTPALCGLSIFHHDSILF